MRGVALYSSQICVPSYLSLRPTYWLGVELPAPGSRLPVAISPARRGGKPSFFCVR